MRALDVEPVHPVQGLELDVPTVSPGLAVDELALVDPDLGLGQGVFVVPDGPDRGVDAGLDQALGERDRGGSRRRCGAPVRPGRWFLPFCDTLSQHTAAIEPEAGYDVFTDEPSGHAAFLETWPSEQALLKHVGWMVESKMVEQIPGCWVPERLSVLDPVTDPQVADVLKQFGALELERISSSGATHGVAGV